MAQSQTIILLALIFFTTACTPPAIDEEDAVQAKVTVKVTHITTGSVNDELTLSATTLYLTRNVVTAPIPAFITRVYIKLGDVVTKGQLLYQLETKERRALGDQLLVPDSSSLSFGKITVHAPAAGTISTLDKQQTGDYVLEGGQLCTIAESNALAFAVNVPYEYNEYAKPGMKCTVVLPDNSVHGATFTTSLTTMNAVSQTQPVLAKTSHQLALPENLLVKIVVSKSQKPQQLLPRAAVLSDEMMENFWVMKLINDSTAVKIGVAIGNRGEDNIEVLRPTFSEADKFLVSGNYALPDTAFVHVVQ